MPPGSPNPDPILDHKMIFSTLVYRIYINTWLLSGVFFDPLISVLSLSFNVGPLQAYLPQFLFGRSSPTVFRPATISFTLRVPEECLFSYIFVWFS